MMAARNTRTEARQPRPPRSPSARGAKIASPSKRARRQGDVEGLVDSIGAIAHQLGNLRTQAHTLGIFTIDHDVLICPKCGLMENVLVGSRLITCHEGNNVKDNGVRFAKFTQESGRFTCTGCGSEFLSQSAEPSGGGR